MTTQDLDLMPAELAVCDQLHRTPAPSAAPLVVLETSPHLQQLLAVWPQVGPAVRVSCPGNPRAGAEPVERLWAAFRGNALRVAELLGPSFPAVDAIQQLAALGLILPDGRRSWLGESWISAQSWRLLKAVQDAARG